ncbi:MAG: hypothetical protein LW842_12810 [Sphingobacteriales bacterium]|nr:hypothetical protein [Sphingobacteriales bacterium]
MYEDMTTIELKEQIVGRLQTTDDNDLLEALLSLLEFEINEPEDYILNEHQVKAIEISRNQIRNGEFYSEEEADKITDEWLKG